MLCQRAAMLRHTCIAILVITYIYIEKFLVNGGCENTWLMYLMLSAWNCVRLTMLLYQPRLFTVGNIVGAISSFFNQFPPVFLL